MLREAEKEIEKKEDGTIKINANITIRTEHSGEDVMELRIDTKKITEGLREAIKETRTGIWKEGKE